MLKAKRKENEVWLQQYTSLIEDTMVLFSETPLYNKGIEMFNTMLPKLNVYLETHDFIKVSFSAFGLLRTAFFFREKGEVIVVSLSVEDGQPALQGISYVDFYMAVAAVQRLFRFQTDNLLPADFSNIIDAINCLVNDKIASSIKRRAEETKENEKVFDENTQFPKDTVAADDLPKAVFTNKYKT